MRERFMEVFDRIRIDCLNGDKYKTGKRTPDGKPDPSVFSTEKNREGIQVGTAIAMMERWPVKRVESATEPYSPIAQVEFRHWWGKEKRAEIGSELGFSRNWSQINPSSTLGVPLLPLGASADYETWPKLDTVFLRGFSGVKTARDRDLVSINLPPLREKIEKYFDPSISLETLKTSAPEITSDDARFDAKKIREILQARGIRYDSFYRYCYRPFDVRWLYWEPETKLLDERRVELRPHVMEENLGLILAQKTRKGFEPPVTTRNVPSYHVVESVSLWFPIFLGTSDTESTPEAPDLFTPNSPTGPRPNLTDFALDYLAKLGGVPEDLFFHLVAILHAPAYREENAGALRQDWPRVPLPADAATLRAGAALGRQLAALLDPETPVPGVTDLKPRPGLKGLGELAVAPGQKTPDLSLDARWGYAGKGGVTMPGPGKVTSGTRGEGFLDIHLNATTRWKDVPEPVWRYTLGGYQVLKKWLSYRESALLGRPLTSDEAQQFTHHVRRIAAILAMGGELDGHYRSSTSDPA